MRMALLSLAASAAFLPSVALAQDEMQDEMQCVYDMLGEEDQDVVEKMVLGSEEESAAAIEEATATLDLASLTCGVVYEWSDLRREAGLDYAMSRVMFDAATLALPAGVSSGQLDTMMDSFPDDVRDSFTYTSQEAMNDAAFDVWAADVSSRLSDGGVAQPDWDAAVDYLSAHADLRVSVSVWSGLFENDIE